MAHQSIAKKPVIQVLKYQEGGLGRHTMRYTMIAMILVAGMAVSRSTATTEDGRKVILHDDGTWEYAKAESSDSADSPTWTAEKIRASITSHCTGKWGTDFSMRKYCQDRNVKAVKDTLARKRPSGMRENEWKAMREACRVKWAPHPDKNAQWNMVDYCESQQIEAFIKLGN